MRRAWRSGQTRPPRIEDGQPIVTLGEGTVLQLDGVSEEVLPRLRITAGRNCVIDLRGLRVVNSGLHVHMVDDCQLTLEPRQDLNGPVRMFMHEPSSISVGADCLWAQGDVWTSDMHSVMDAATHERVNPVADVRIGRHVWLGHDFIVLGGTEIGDDSIVAARAVVTGKTFPANTLIGGTPARALRRGVTWDSQLL